MKLLRELKRVEFHLRWTMMGVNCRRFVLEWMRGRPRVWVFAIVQPVVIGRG